MYAYSSFPSRFAVFRGPYHPTLRTEIVDSIMIFDTTPSDDGSFYTATMRSWFGTIVGDDNMPDKTVRTVKIHSPLRTNHHGLSFSPSNERFVVLPFSLEMNVAWVHNAIPILAFESNNWMPRFDERLVELQLLHKVQSEVFKHHYQNIQYVAGTLMRRTEPIADYIQWLRSLPDPYSIMNHADIRAIPFWSISPTNIHTLRRNTIEELYHSAIGEVAADLAGAMAEADAAAGDDYSSMFDAAAGYVAPEEEAEEEAEAEAEAEPEPEYTDEERLAEAAQAARNAALEYSRLRKEYKAHRDPSVPIFRSMWIKKPTADGRDVEPIPDEMATEVEVRMGTDGCPWPYHVYVNHARAEIEKGSMCPITMERLSECKVVNVSMNCGHIYEARAITKWTNVTGAQNAPCPSCRTPIAGMWQMRVKPRAEAAADS